MHAMTNLLDRALDFTVLPGYSRIGFALRGLHPLEPVPDSLENRVVLVTGGGSGLGEAACEGFAAAGADVHMLVRDQARGERALSRITSRRPDALGSIELEVCDLSSLSSVRRFAESFQARRDRLDLLVNNAGVLPQERAYSPDGVELTFATNVLGPFLLTSLLLSVLLLAAPSRVITVSSGGMYTARLDADDPQLERRELRRSALLRAREARPGRPEPSSGRALSGRPDRISCHAPGLGRHCRASAPPCRASGG